MAATKRVLFAVLVSLLAAAAAASEQSALLPRQPKDLFSSEGGSIRVWSPDFEALKDASAGAALITLEAGGLALPKYADAAHLAYVLEGSARVGLHTPFGLPANVKRVKAGDVLVIPRGWPVWWHNDGNERTRVFSVAETSLGEPGEYTSFPLVGGAQKDGKFGSLLHGFSKDVLAAAWDIDEATVEKLLSSQKQALIIKVGKRGPAEDPAVNSYFGDFVYNLDESQPELINAAGKLNVLTKYKLPVLKKIGLGAARFKLKPGAIWAPNWSPNAHRIVYVTSGKGRIQIAYNTGEQALDSDVSEGSLVVIPKFHPATLVAKDHNLEWISVETSPTPIVGFLAGKLSVFKYIPLDILTAAFNIDKDVEEKIRSKRQEEAIILSPPGQEPGFIAQVAEGFVQDFSAYAADVKDYFDELLN